MRAHKVHMPRNTPAIEMTERGNCEDTRGEDAQVRMAKVRFVPTMQEFRQRGGVLIHGPSYASRGNR
jgi:hypothetical protein